MKTEQTPRPYSSAKDLMERTEKELSKGESAHTPGPWRVQSFFSEEACDLVITDSRNQHVIADCRSNDGVEDCEEAEANARLIAAAPELLAALKDLRERVVAEKVDCLNTTKADAAIRSAEGRSNE